MQKLRFAIVVLMLALGLMAGCSVYAPDVMRALFAALPEESGASGPLGGQVAALPTPDPAAVTATPPPSSISFPTPASGPLATLTAVAGLIPTIDLNATPYEITYRGVPIFIEFQARW
ncbi:MAG: hypothetical protein Kow0077_27240 [Anaerolineae bacterium]